MTVRTPDSKIMTLAQAVAWRQTLRGGNLRLALTNGCFDLLHRGHAEYLARARESADALLVAVNSDASVKALKGPSRPVVSEPDRAFLLASLEAVDAVVVFATVKPTGVFRQVRPDVYVKGGDYTIDTIDREERDVLMDLGCEFRFIPFVPGFSTTSTISRVRGQG